MNNISLHKVIKSLVLKKYDWIVDYRIEFYFDSLEKYTVIYYVNPDENGAFTITEEFKEVDELTNNLFKMLAPRSTQVLDGVVFRIKEKSNHE